MALKELAAFVIGSILGLVAGAVLGAVVAITWTIEEMNTGEDSTIDLEDMR